MKKTTKALAVGATGLALVAGTGATYALWGETLTFGAADSAIETGHLSLEHATGEHVRWHWQVARDGVVVYTAFGTGQLPELVYGGDIITAYTLVDARLQGHSLLAELVSQDQLTGGQSLIDGAQVTSSVEVAESGFRGLLTAGTPGLDQILIRVTITIPQLPLLPPGLDSNTQPVDFGGFELVLRQVIEEGN